ncbi:cation-translocating P-type ATPase [Sediminibacterium sp.]|uniref:cation-translocating P-type ATPase n=1 Tax=Sediminibacterium sp. TaxID=1917865 RepID=UPI002731F070|nr:cation-translocating P-type ATPase [Sediminibacterium sp.]MDP2419962.1 cation-translocating P-type ATPase [Sediminibacterium sp.]
MIKQFLNIDVNEALKELHTSTNGLSQLEATNRLAKYGPNELVTKKNKPIWVYFFAQFKDFMILILMVAAIISGLMGDVADTIIILIIILLNALLGFSQEYKAEKSMEALKQMSITKAQVVREGRSKIIPSEQLVPGDIIHLEAGNIVPADLRLVEIFAISIDESSLTGESSAVHKKVNIIANKDISLGDQLNMAFKGTLVTGGRAVGLVVATGMNTELGKIANLLQEDKLTTPLQKRMGAFGKNLSYIILLICLVLFVSGLVRGEEPFKLLLLSISLAVAAIPEALPALITIALSKGAARLAKHKALVRKLPAVETLGSVSFICTDKTGTLTQNKMKVVEQFEKTDSAMPISDTPLLLAIILNQDIQFDQSGEPIGESTELALVKYGIEQITLTQFHQQFQQFPRVAEIPFDSDRKCMTTIHSVGNRFLVIVKGASERIQSLLVNQTDKKSLLTLSNQWAEQGMRIIAYGYKMLDQLPQTITSETIENDLEWIGQVGLMDPPRTNVIKVIQECIDAGINPVMITGDHPATAKAIAMQVGIMKEHDLVMLGSELAHLSDVQFKKQVLSIKVYARVSPNQKLRIVKALQSHNHFVAMTGDGVNDAPSLKAANIGVAMGITGTDVSKEAADIILLDDGFATIVNAVKEGRRIVDNIRKFIKYIMTCNGAEIWTIFLAPLLGMPIPLLPIHILWINLVTDGLPALALANEKAEVDIMKRPPRNASESLFEGGLGYHILWVGLLMAGVTLATQAYAIHNQSTHWQTMVFTVLSLAQLGHVLAVRSDKTFLFKQGIFSNSLLLLSVLFTFCLQLAVIYIPFLNELFKTEPLSLKELGFCILMATIVFHAVELEKLIKRLQNIR